MCCCRGGCSHPPAGGARQPQGFRVDASIDPYNTERGPGLSTVRDLSVENSYAFLIFSFALAAVSRAASFAAAASSRRRSMAVRVAASVSA